MNRVSIRVISAASALVIAGAFGIAQQAPGGFGGRGPAAPPPWIAQGYDDHQNMMDQLGVKTLRPGKNGNNQVGKGFDDATGNDMMSSLPDVLKMKDGAKVTNVEQWGKRRAEVLDDFECEVYGRIPVNTPKVTWEITSTANGMQNGVPTITRYLTGHVDNSSFPQITVDIHASFTIPVNATGALPIMIEFGGATPPGAGRGRGFGGAATGPAGRGFGRGAAATGPAGRGFGRPTTGPAGRGLAGGRGGPAAQGGEPQPTGLSYAAAPINNPQGVGGADGPINGSVQQAIQYGWAYGAIDPGSIQADGGGNALRQGIIGLCNKGEPRKPEDWGALRAWQWGVSQLIEYFAANPDSHVDSTKLGIEGVSRYGKAALVAEAFEPRVAVAFVASSGEGGVKLHRHDVGEAVENLTGGEYYWMGGNFIKYGASDIKGKAMTAADIPVDSHELVALCAPRPCFLSNGIPNPRIQPGIGDPLWIDAHGSYMAGVLASPVYALYGEKGFGNPSLFFTDPEKFYNDPMPALSTLVGGQLAWREHEGGHTAAPNFPAFYKWIGQYIKSPMPPPTPAAPAAPAGQQ